MADRIEHFRGDPEDEWSGSGNRLGGSGETEILRSEIIRSRERISHTVDEIADRLDPERLKSRLKNDIHDATVGKAEHMARVAVNRVDDTRHDLMDSIRENPIPAAMVGIGLGWLFLNSRRDHETSARRWQREPDWRSMYPQAGWQDELPRGARPHEESIGERVSDFGASAKDRASEVIDRAQDRVSEIAYDARDTIRGMTDRAQERVGSMHAGEHEHRHGGMGSRSRRQQLHRMEDRFEDVLHDAPLAMGAAAVALGLAIGLSAPATERESEWMGGVRDDLMERAREKADDLTDRVGERAGHLSQQMGSGRTTSGGNTSRVIGSSDSSSNRDLSGNEPMR